nr:MAG TPA: hypothetical protein [Caudoviricetes sp.]
MSCRCGREPGGRRPVRQLRPEPCRVRRPGQRSNRCEPARDHHRDW